MADGAKTPKKTPSAARRQRLAAELRANLGRRKAQARAQAGADKTGAAPGTRAAKGNADDTPKDG